MADVSVTGASVIPASGSLVQAVTAGATVTAGQVVYKDTSDSNQYKPADSDAAASAVGAGIAITDAEDEQPFVICTQGDLAVGTAGCVSIGTPYVVSSNAGGIAPFADAGSANYITHLGIATLDTTITLRVQSSGVAIP